MAHCVSTLWNGVLLLWIIVVREWIGSGSRRRDRQSTGAQSHIDDTELLIMYGFKYTLVVTTPKNGMTNGVHILWTVNELGVEGAKVIAKALASDRTLELSGTSRRTFRHHFSRRI